MTGRFCLSVSGWLSVFLSFHGHTLYVAITPRADSRGAFCFCGREQANTGAVTVAYS